LSGYGYEQEPRFEYGPVSREPDYGQFGQYPEEAPEPGEKPRSKTTKLLIVGGGVIALLLVGMVAFAGTVLLGGGSSGSKHNVASGTGGGQEVADPATSPSGQTPTDPPTSAAPSPTDPTPSPTKAAPSKTPTTQPGGVVNPGPEGAVLAIVNAERAKAGCGPLTIDARLAAAARKHSADMLARKYFSHVTPDGVTMAQRIDREGYRWWAIGENIAAGQREPADVMRAWMNSPGHRANILNCKFKQIGIGVAGYPARNAPGRPVWTQDFGTPR
jgi:uncharacterized protein YkwD